MDYDHISQKESSATDASNRVYGTPTVAELQRRVDARQQAKKKKGNRKKL